MAIKRLSITNFRSFKKLDVDLGKFSLFIGANASGKSNFIQIFRFLRDIIQSGLDNAISLQGGIGYLRNINIGRSENLSIEVISDTNFGYALPKDKKAGTGVIGLRFYEFKLDFSLEFKNGDFEIAKDEVEGKFNYFSLRKKVGVYEEKEKLGEGQIKVFRSNGNIEYKLSPDVPVSKESFSRPVMKELKEDILSRKALMIEKPFLFFLLNNLADIFRSMAIYDFDPKLPKKATPITGKADLEEDGSNLSIVLKNIVENQEKKAKFCNLICEFLPFVDDLDVEKFADKSLLFKLREKYYEKEYLPASFISDGTINISALITALFFEKKGLTIIEEPERNIHPQLISKVTTLLKDAAGKKRIIATTHNPEMVKHAGIDNIFLVSRSKEGYSTISKPGDKDTVKVFLKNEIGIDELFVKSLLEV